MLANRHTHRSDRKDPLNLKSLILGNKRGKIEQSFWSIILVPFTADPRPLYFINWAANSIEIIRICFGYGFLACLKI